MIRCEGNDDGSKRISRPASVSIKHQRANASNDDDAVVVQETACAPVIGSRCSLLFYVPQQKIEEDCVGTRYIYDLCHNKYIYVASSASTTLVNMADGSSNRRHREHGFCDLPARCSSSSSLRLIIIIEHCGFDHLFLSSVILLAFLVC